MSADTIVPGAGNPQALNRYAYVYNNPLMYVDPSGHSPCDDPYWPTAFEEATGREPTESDYLACQTPNWTAEDWELYFQIHGCPDCVSTAEPLADPLTYILAAVSIYKLGPVLVEKLEIAYLHLRNLGVEALAKACEALPVCRDYVLDQAARAGDGIGGGEGPLTIPPDMSVADLASGLPFRANQTSVDPARIEEYANMMREGVWNWSSNQIEIIRAANGDFIVDGHHRALAANLAGISVPETGIIYTDIRPLNWPSQVKSWIEVIWH